MISQKDYSEKQILFLESSKFKKLKFINFNICFYDDENKKVILKHSCYKIFLIFIVGDISITSVLIKNCKKFHIPIIFLNYNLKPYFYISIENKGNFLLREKQYLCKKDLELSKHIIINKAENQLFLLEDIRYKTIKDKLAVDKIKYFIGLIEKVKDSKELLGIEGNISKLFFQNYFKNCNFKFRRAKTREDPINLLFDIGYHYLFNFIEANLEFYGFDVFFGFYHKLFYQRKSLVCDMIEPFRCIIDRKIKKGFNLKQIDLNDFEIKKNQYYIKKEFNKKYSSFFLKEIISYKNEIFFYIKNYYSCFLKDQNIEEYQKFILKRKK